MFVCETVLRWSLRAMVAALLMASLALNAVQRAAVRALEGELAASGAAQMLSEDAVVPAVAAKDLSGGPANVSYGDADYTVLYVFRPSCIWCARNRALINRVSDHAGQRFRFIGITTVPHKEAAAYLSTHELTFPAYADVSETWAKAYKLGVTPQTIVVGRGGRVLKVWSGAFTGNTKTEVESYFSVKLPDLDWSAGG